MLTSTMLTLCNCEKLAVIMLDGFRWDYLDINVAEEEVPNFRRFLDQGVRYYTLIQVYSGFQGLTCLTG